MSNTIRAAMTPLGPVHVRLTSIVRGDSKGPGIAIVNAPTTAEATAELHRVARVSGADKVVSVAADYRRAALAGGTTSTQWRIEVQAWGTAMAPVKVEPGEQPEEQRAQDAEKAKDQAKNQDDAKKAQDAQESGAPSKPREVAASDPAAAQRVEAPPSTVTPASGAETAATTGDTPSAPNIPSASDR